VRGDCENKEIGLSLSAAQKPSPTVPVSVQKSVEKGEEAEKKKPGPRGTIRTLREAGQKGGVRSLRSTRVVGTGGRKGHLRVFRKNAKGKGRWEDRRC